MDLGGEEPEAEPELDLGMEDTGSEDEVSLDIGVDALDLDESGEVDLQMDEAVTEEPELDLGAEISLPEEAVEPDFGLSDAEDSGDGSSEMDLDEMDLSASQDEPELDLGADLSVAEEEVEPAMDLSVAEDVGDESSEMDLGGEEPEAELDLDLGMEDTGSEDEMSLDIGVDALDPDEPAEVDLQMDEAATEEPEMDIGVEISVPEEVEEPNLGLSDAEDSGDESSEMDLGEMDLGAELSTLEEVAEPDLGVEAAEAQSFEEVEVAFDAVEDDSVDPEDLGEIVLGVTASGDGVDQKGMDLDVYENLQSFEVLEEYSAAAPVSETESEKAREISDFIDREQLVEKMEESRPAGSDFQMQPTQAPEEVVLDQLQEDSDLSVEMEIEDSEEQEIAFSPGSDLFSVPGGWLQGIQNSVYMLEDGYVDLEVKPPAPSPLQASTDMKSKHLPFKVGEWDSIILGQGLGLVKLRQKLSTLFLEDRAFLPELMRFCEFHGLEQKNYQATFVLSEIHAEMGEDLSALSLKAEVLAQIQSESSSHDELLLCLELRKQLPFQEDLIGRIAKCYRLLGQVNDRTIFFTDLIDEQIRFGRLSEAQKYFQLCQDEGMMTQDFVEVGIRLFKEIGEHQRIIDLIDTVGGEISDKAKLGLCKADALRVLGRHENALDEFKRALSQSDAPVPIMEKIVTLLQEMQRVDQLQGFVNQLLSLDPQNQCGIQAKRALSVVQEKPVLETPQSSSMEQRLEAMLESKFRQLASPAAVQDENPSPVPEPTKPQREFMVQPQDLADAPNPFNDQVKTPIELERKPSEPVVPVVKPEVKDEPKVSPEPVARLIPGVPAAKVRELQELEQRIKDKEEQGDILAYLKLVKEIMERSGIDVADQGGLKSQALDQARLIKDPILGYFWTREIQNF